MRIQHSKDHNICQRLQAVMSVVDYIRKDQDKVGGKYTAVTHDQLTEKLHPLFVEHGILVVPYLVSERTAPTAQKTAKGVEFIRLETVWDVTFKNVDVPTEFETVRVPAHALDEGDKAPGKVASYAVKAAELKILMIVSGDEEERRPEEATLTADELIEIKDGIANAADVDTLRSLLATGMDRAARAHDKSAHAQIKAAAEARAQALGVAVRESSTRAPSAKAPNLQKPKGEPASAGIIKNIQVRGRALKLDDVALCDRAKVEKLADLTKEQAGALLKSLQSESSGV